MKQLRLLIWVLVIFAVVSCEQKDLCYDHEPHAHRTQFQLRLSFECEWEYNIENHIDWEQQWKPEYGIAYEDIAPKEPEGVRVHIYNEDDQTETVRNLTRQHNTISFNEEGHYDMIFYNNDTEYILFEGFDSFHTAKATTRGGHVRNAVMNTPDMLFGAFVDSIFVERQAVPDTLDVVLRPLVYTYLLRFEVTKGAGLIKHADGVLSGMATGVHLSKGHTTTSTGLLTFECTMQGDYGVQALVRSFGIPGYPTPHYSRGYEETYPHELYLNVSLTNGKTQSFKYDITEQMRKQPHGGVILIQDMEIEENSTGGGAFNVGVDGWGEIVHVPLN